MTDGPLLSRIRNDDVDAVVDLCRHSVRESRSRFGTREAVASVQALCLGCLGATGLPNMDYVICDSGVSRPELHELYSEWVLWLANCLLCFHSDEGAPDFAALPRDNNGFIPSGSFNNLPKISPRTIRLWSQVLLAVPRSRLVMKTLSFQDRSTRDLLHKQFEEHGIRRSRVDLLPPTVSFAKFLNEYRRIDIGLDSRPCHGGTTTCEALWMGVPVITTPGDQFGSRMGLSILKTVGLSELVVSSNSGLIRIACELPDDTTRVRSMRPDLRRQLRDSALCDAAAFIRDFENQLRIG
jgi:protein O-GlcNAc transferase